MMIRKVKINVPLPNLSGYRVLLYYPETLGLSGLDKEFCFTYEEALNVIRMSQTCFPFSRAQYIIDPNERLN